MGTKYSLVLVKRAATELNLGEERQGISLSRLPN